MGEPRRIIDDQLHAHFVTFSVDGRRRWLDLDPSRRLLLCVLNEELETRNARCLGFVVMPDHVHAVVWFPTPGRLSGFMHAWKRKSSFQIRERARRESDPTSAAIAESERFWLPKYYSFEIHGRAKLEEKLCYMHENPVRAGIVARPIDWEWSSARWYELGETVGVPIQWVE